MKKQLYNLDITIAEFILPLLKEFKKETNGYPNNFKTMEDWQEALDKMIFSFEYVESEKIMLNLRKNGEYEKYSEGMKIFSENFHNLWI